MEMCKRCKLAKKCVASSESDVCLNYEPRQQTNYDLLISKTPEELAKWLDDNDSNFPISDGGEHWLLWLQSPVEPAEEDND